MSYLRRFKRRILNALNAIKTKENKKNSLLSFVLNAFDSCKMLRFKQAFSLFNLEVGLWPQSPGEENVV